MDVIISAEPVKKEKKKGYDKWEIESAVDTLVRAEEIKQNKELMAACCDSLDKKKNAIKSIDGLRALANKMDREEMMGEDDSEEE